MVSKLVITLYLTGGMRVNKLKNAKKIAEAQPEELSSVFNLLNQGKSVPKELKDKVERRGTAFEFLVEVYKPIKPKKKKLANREEKNEDDS